MNYRTRYELRRKRCQEITARVYQNGGAVPHCGQCTAGQVTYCQDHDRNETRGA